MRFLPLLGKPNDSTEDLDHRLRRVYLTLGAMAIAAGAIWALVLILPAIHWALDVILPFLAALVVAYIFNPVVGWIQTKLKLNRGISILVLAAMALTALAIGLGIVAIAFIQLEQAVEQMIQNAPQAMESMVERLPEGTVQDVESMLEAQMDDADVSARQVFQAIWPRLSEGAAGVAQGVASWIGSFFGALSLIFFVLIITLYYLVDMDRGKEIAVFLIPPDRRDKILDIAHKIDRSVGGFLRGQLISAAIVGILTTVFLTIYGPRKWAILIGIVAGVFNIIPYLGPIAGATPAVLWALMTESLEGMERVYMLGYLAIVFSAVQSIDGFILQPRIVGKSAQLHPLAVLLALIIGGQFGLAGMIVAVPVACIVRVLILELWWTPLKEKREMQSESG